MVVALWGWTRVTGQAGDHAQGLLQERESRRCGRAGPVQRPVQHAPVRGTLPRYLLPAVQPTLPPPHRPCPSRKGS